MPFYEFSGLKSQLDFNSIWTTGQHNRLAVFTSPRSVEYGLAQIPSEQIADLKIAAMGPATEKALNQRGHQVDIQAQSGFTSEEFLALAALDQSPGEAVIFCAPGGRKALQKGLESKQWKVSLAFVYQREPLQLDDDKVRSIAKADHLISIWTSVSAVEIASKSFPASIWMKVLAAPVLVISTRIQHYLQQQGAKRISLVAGPGNPEIVDSIAQLMKGDWK